MAYRRRGRPTFYFEARTETGRKQLSTGTPRRELASKIESMWDDLATSHRAWDLLGEVMAGRIAIGRLFDYWRDCKGDVRNIRLRLADVDVSSVIEEWARAHAHRVQPDSAAHALAHVRYFFPEGCQTVASSVTPEWLTLRLAHYPGKRNTIRKVHSSLSMFLGYCTDVRGIFRENPMSRVDRPPVERTPIRYYDIETVLRIVNAQPTEERKVLFALLYGAAIEVSVALRLTRSDIDVYQHEVRASGTKAHSRDRICLVADWAWEIVAPYLRTLMPNAPLFPTTPNRWTVSDWHRQTIGGGSKDTHGRVTVSGLNLPRRFPLHCARDHWAVRAARAGTPIALIQSQLGHASAMLTVTKYARFLPTSRERAQWEKVATENDTRIREAK